MEICYDVSEAETSKANRNSQRPGEEMRHRRGNKEMLFSAHITPCYLFCGYAEHTKGHDEALERGYDGHIRGICPHLLNLKALER